VTVPIPSQKPPPEELPPPPPAPVPSCTDYQEWDPDNDAPGEIVRAELAQAGARLNWRPGVSTPFGWPGGPYPEITVPADLMDAVAFTESSWRSTVIACDGGIGLMQVMPNTATWMNQRFGRSDDVDTVDGNAALGAMYLQWLTMYFGLYYFGSFDLDAVAPVGAAGAPLRLGDVVIAAYNVGYGSVENSDDTLSIPNQWYVERVKDYVASCPCDSL
jgi:soluble lytic murein transglycosylase-like protein